ncbi:hypothetical protein [uncultured Sanguibacteroides sp.]|nr:hypothetical protein [uncultured Sanguibacteroides sp.]
MMREKSIGKNTQICRQETKEYNKALSDCTRKAFEDKILSQVAGRLSH